MPFKRTQRKPFGPQCDVGTFFREVNAGDQQLNDPGLLGREHHQVVVAQGLGDEDRQAPRDEEGDRSAGASPGRDHASHMG